MIPVMRGLILFAWIIGVAVQSEAAIDCDQPTLQAAVTAASAGDTITCNAGEWTWEDPVTWSNKELTITGATCTGSGSTLSCSTIITGDVGTSPLITANTCSASNFVTISHLRLQVLDTGSSNGMININCNNVAGYPPVAFRLHHIQMIGDATDGTTNNSNGPRFVMVSVYGVTDHSSFISSTSRGMGNLSMQQDNAPTTPNVYHVPFEFGDANAFYIENNYFYFAVGNQGNGTVDHYTGARYVFRFNTVYNNNIGNHGWDSQPRGTATFEDYGNTYIAESGITAINRFQPRSGTGIIWGNVVKNIQPQTASQGYITFFQPNYYGALTVPALAGNINLNSRARGYYPSGTWGTIPYPGTSSVFDDVNNYVTGSNPIDGNQIAAGHWDDENSRTVTDLNTTEGDSTITSATASFVATDVQKDIEGTNIPERRTVTDGVLTSGSPEVTSATANFTDGDVGMWIGNPDVDIPHNTTIISVTNSTTATMSANATASTDPAVLVLAGPYIVSVTNSTTAELNVKATGTTAAGTLTIGYRDQGYPLADQPGRGYFASANAGNWPLSASYTDADYEALMPIYLVANLWQTTDADLVVLTSDKPPATTEAQWGVAAYNKADRDYYEPAGQIQTSASSPFDGTSGTGTGTLANRPATCTAGVGYWALDQGSWNSSSTTYTYPNGGSSYANGLLYKCTATDTWDLYYTPYDYPYPGTEPEPSDEPGVSSRSRMRFR